MKHFRGGTNLFLTCSAALLRLVVGWVAKVMTPWLGEPARPPSQISTPIARGHEDSPIDRGLQAAVVLVGDDAAAAAAGCHTAYLPDLILGWVAYGVGASNTNQLRTAGLKDAPSSLR
jgi:hypothetical protein